MSPAITNGIVVDDSMWPLVMIQFVGAPSDDDVRDMFRAYERFYARRERFHVVNQGASVRSAFSASQRKLIAAAAREHEHSSRKWCLGGAAVVTNAIARGVVTAITWLAPPAYKLTLHATLAEALDEAIRTLERNGITVPPGSRQLRSKLRSTAA